MSNYSTRFATRLRSKSVEFLAFSSIFPLIGAALSRISAAKFARTTTSGQPARVRSRPVFRGRSARRFFVKFFSFVLKNKLQIFSCRNFFPFLVSSRCPEGKWWLLIRCGQLGETLRRKKNYGAGSTDEL